MTDTWKKLEGQKDEIVGKVKEMWGKTTEDAETQARGIAQQVEGEIKQAAATGRGNAEELAVNAEARAEQAEEQIKRQITETREAIEQSADENLKEAIDEGKRLKEEAAARAEELRQQAIADGEKRREEYRESSTRATDEIDNIKDRAETAINEALDSREEADQTEEVTETVIVSSPDYDESGKEAYFEQDNKVQDQVTTNQQTDSTPETTAENYAQVKTAKAHAIDDSDEQLNSAASHTSTEYVNEDVEVKKQEDFNVK